jgi:hypothetical protein
MADPVAPWPDAPRLGPAEPFPPYRHVPGATPHPRRDPRGHAHGVPETPARHVPPERWREDQAYLRGIDLYHAGYLWEAHEAWEGTWKASSDPAQREFLRALIQLAACLLKAHLGQERGARKLAATARARLDGVPAVYMGLDTEALGAWLHGFLEGKHGGVRGPRLAPTAPRASPPA